MSLNTGDAIDSTSLWAWNSLPPDARKMTSASGGFFHSVAIMRAADKYTGVNEGRPPHFHERLHLPAVPRHLSDGDRLWLSGRRLRVSGAVFRV